MAYIFRYDDEVLLGMSRASDADLIAEVDISEAMAADLARCSHLVQSGGHEKYFRSAVRMGRIEGIGGKVKIRQVYFGGILVSPEMDRIRALVSLLLT